MTIFWHKSIEILKDGFKNGYFLLQIFFKLQIELQCATNLVRIVAFNDILPLCSINWWGSTRLEKVQSREKSNSCCIFVFWKPSQFFHQNTEMQSPFLIFWDWTFSKRIFSSQIFPSITVVYLPFWKVYLLPDGYIEDVYRKYVRHNYLFESFWDLHSIIDYIRKDVRQNCHLKT